MKTLLDFLKPGHRGQNRSSDGDTATVRKIVRRLEALDPQRARYIAAFAYILGRVANADLDISEAESAKMEEIVGTLGELPDEQALLVVEMAKGQNRLFGGTENFQVTREFKALASKEQCRELLHCLFAVSAADDTISNVEEGQVRQIAEELGFSHGEYIEVRSAYNDQRSVIQRLKRREPS